MTSGVLLPTEVSRLGDHLLQELQARPVSRPEGTGLGEVSFTAQWVRPLVESTIARLDHRGLLVAGDGGARVKPVPAFGLLFTPDVTVSYYEQLLFALEVKLVRDRQGQSTITRGIGQAAIYREGGYPVTAVLALDAGGLPRGIRYSHVAEIPVVVREVALDFPRIREESLD